MSRAAGRLRSPGEGLVRRGPRHQEIGGRNSCRTYEFRPCRHHRRGARHGHGVFVGLGLEVEGRMFVEGEFVDPVIGIPGSRSQILMLRPPEGGTGLELSSFVWPEHEPGSPAAMAMNWGCATCHLKSTIFRRRSTGWLRTATPWSAASVSTRTSGAWPTCAGPEGMIVSLAERIGGRPPTSQPVGASSGADTTGRRPGALRLAGRVDAEFGDQHRRARAVLADPVRDRRPGRRAAAERSRRRAPWGSRRRSASTGLPRGRWQ